ncbi:8-oxo-dGDP phosphatase NUDT18 [Orussus abietinus]|uniref:8-oxo-dGDP phosphatase NUDT18 n=1 Tax=Orussus abietinus TaxID=222816 RepID=UPI0006251679|nr:8-oxo-dGDP phosphatase NUDT18 [Orussus abietinus]XP_012276988.1 8-oxo-dGDP phosphatase NUDT18 [Orussus abietinus]XP_012276989.1 8-oxo-dGDP phosphatase NUDT18 [Orussus abietinus]
MPDVIEDKIRLVLAGQNLNDDDFCDFSLEQQNEALEVKGIQPMSSSDYTPICQKTVTYIVAAVIVNDQDEVLMMQEAKPSCAGEWYLPAGRVEKNETLVEAVKREVLEETGLIMEPKTLLMVECVSGSWFRFVMTGEILGGTIKTPEQANEEALQASWVQKVEDLSLRAKDILPLIQKAREYTKSKGIPWHPSVLPMVQSRAKLYLRLIVCIKKKATNRLHVLISEKSALHLPIAEINPGRNVHSTLHRFMVDIFGDSVPQHRPHGLLSVEFSGGQSGDGVCLTLLVSFKPPLEEVPIFGKYIWHELAQSLAESLTARLPRNMTVPLNVIR